MLADRRYCYPLTVTDAASRYLICCEALSSTQASLALTVFERLFKDFGLPNAIRTDNGVPFASPKSLFNLSKLSVCHGRGLSYGVYNSVSRPSRVKLTAPHLACGDRRLAEV